MFSLKRCAFQTIRPVVSRKKRGFAAHFRPGSAVPPPPEKMSFFIITNSPAGVMPCGAVALPPARMAGTGVFSLRYRGTLICSGCLRRRNADSPDEKFSGEGWGPGGKGEPLLKKGLSLPPRQLPTSCTGRAGPRRLPRRDARIPRRSCLRGHFREAAARACWQVQAGAVRRRMPGRCC